MGCGGARGRLGRLCGSAGIYRSADRRIVLSCPRRRARLGSRLPRAALRKSSMQWSLTKSPSLRVLSQADAGEPMEDAVRRSVVLTRLQDLVAWARKNSIWPFNFG